MLINAGMLNYSNALPLCYKMEEDQEIVLSYDTPQRLYHGLKEQSLDYCITSSLHIKDENLQTYSDYCIAANKEVLSVTLYHKIPLSYLSGQEIAISCETATSFALLKILCRELWHITPTFTLLSSFDSIENFAAVLLIGDCALENREGFIRCDLASAWYELTGLPFVFALFFSHKESKTNSHFEKKIEASLQMGLDNLNSIATKVALEKKLPFNLLHHYYQTLIFKMGSQEKKGLEQFITLTEARL